MPSSRPTSSGGRRPANATLSGAGATHRSNSAINLSNEHYAHAGGSAAGPSNSSAADSVSRRYSNPSEGNDEGKRSAGGLHHHRVGPKRKSKVGISGLADPSPFGYGHARKKNASSSALSRRDKSRSHLALTHVANDVAGLSQVADGQGHSQYAGRSGKSRERRAKSQQPQQRPVEQEEVREAPTPPADTAGGPADDDNEAGWVSATSSAAATPLAGTSPMSPESYKPLEFGKKPRRKKAPAAEHVQPLDFPKYEPRQSLQRTGTEEEELLGTTPRQHESALSLAAPKSLASPSALSKTLSRQTNDDQTATPEPALASPDTSSGTKLQSQDAHKADDSGFNAEEHPSDLPRVPVTNQQERPSTMRKTSTSTIRSLASIGGTRPLSSSIRRQTLAPLQPRLDTSVEGLGQLKHVGLTPKENDTAFPSAPSTSRTHRRHNSGASLGVSKAGTLAPKEAEELAKRLRTVSGSDLPASDAGEPDFGQYPVRGTLRRSASTAQGATLASLQKYGISSPRGENAPSSTASGAFGTLKRASGYFGSMSRLTSLGSTLGLTSLDKGAQNPSPTSPGPRRTPSSSGSMAAVQSSTSPMQRLQGAYGLRGARSNAVQVRQPVISKFIDPSESYQPFPKASTSPTTMQSRPSGLARGGTSRARQKLLTQRDYPDEYSFQYEGAGGGSGISDEDPMASQVNLRKNLSSKNLSGTATPLQPGVQRWLVALSKEAERIDREHETFGRFHDTMQASFARILERRSIQEQQAQETLASKAK